MKLNTDCVRDILITVENKELGKELTFANLCSMIPSYSEDEIYYACIKLSEADYLEVKTINLCGYQRSPIHHIGELTYLGHEFLSSIKNEDTWSKTKELASKVGSNSLKSLSQIATGVITELIKSQFN